MNSSKNARSRCSLAIAALIAAICCLALPGLATAETVLTCAEPWGSSDSCGGCSGMSWQAASGTVKVKTTASDFWQLLSNLKPTDSVSTSTQPPGTIATCAQVTGKKTVAELLGSTPAVPVPPTTPFPTSGPGQFTVTWPPVLKGTKNEDVSKDITGYCIYYGLTVGSMATKYCVGNVTMATVTNLPAGFYYLQMTAVAGKEESEKTSAGSVNVAGTPTVPPVVPPPIPPTVSVYHVKAIASGTRPATEAVLPTTGQGFVPGYKLGDVPVGKPCGDLVIYKSGTSEYHSVNENDAILLSPTYKGRQLVAVCGK